MDHLCHLFIVFLTLLRLFIAALWSLAGKWMNYWLLLVMFIVFLLLSRVVSRVRYGTYLIVSVSDLCHLSYFDWFSVVMNCISLEASMRAKQLYLTTKET